MKSEQSFTLLQETHSPSEAREAIMNLLSSQIKFYSLRNLRSFERTGSDDPYSKQRIEELTQARQQLKEMIKNAEEQKLSVDISSQININFEH